MVYGQFSLLLQKTTEQIWPESSQDLPFTRTDGSTAAIWSAVTEADNAVCNLPIVAWKRVIFRPLLTLFLARLRGRRVTLVLHEWGSLHWLRRLTFLPALVVADTVVMFSPLIRSELEGDRFAGWFVKKCVLAPLPSNIEVPAQVKDSDVQGRLSKARLTGRLVVGQFGSIYPGKQPQALLDIVSVLKHRGLNPLAVYVGSFIRGLDNVEDKFYARVRELGLTDNVIVSGYVECQGELFGIFREIDVFVYPLSEGLSARRSSILASVQSGRPVVVTGPKRPDEFDHHLRFSELIKRGTIVLLPGGNGDEAFADRIVAVRSTPTVNVPIDFKGWWEDAARAIARSPKSPTEYLSVKRRLISWR